MKRRVALLVAPLVVVACDGGTLAPNTDVGLLVWAEARPASLSIRDSLTVVRLRVKAENPSRDQIRVVTGAPPYRSTRDPASSRGLWGSVRIACGVSSLNCGPGVDWTADSIHLFAPGEVQYRETSFTLKSWRAGGWTLAPGSYRVRAWFNAREGTSASFEVLP